jgi:hypothetical protein
VFSFSYFRSRDGERWVLSGQLCRPWIDGLRSLWRCFRYRAPRCHVVVGIKEVTALDTVGAQLLEDMSRAGVEFTENEVEENPVVRTSDGCGAQAVASRRAGDRQTP